MELVVSAGFPEGNAFPDETPTKQRQEPKSKRGRNERFVDE